VVTAHKAIFITDSRYTLVAQKQVTGFELINFSTPKSGIDVLLEKLAAVGAKSVGFEGDFITVAQEAAWKEKFTGYNLVSLGDAITQLRMIKTPDEVARIRRSCELTDKCFDHLIRLVQPGITEYEIQLEAEFFYRRNGAQLGFEPIIVSGPNSAMPHGKATDKPLAEGEFVTFDMGAKLDGYCADMTRTVVVGKADERTKHVYETVLKANLAAIDFIRTGKIAADVDAVARDIFAAEGWGSNFGHGLGHGLGIYVHDPGRLGIGSKTVIEPGQVWTIEPGVYFDGWGGCRIEDDVVITDTGIEILNSSTKELLELPR
ncbi:MAG TPA: Xaa-Pro peptidase family protein, partial [Fimbriimonas sp.]|nr:Xaa-Pro peptidase family protein [Fimbriimonas sp.]